MTYNLKLLNQIIFLPNDTLFAGNNIMKLQFNIYRFRVTKYVLLVLFSS